MTFHRFAIGLSLVLSIASGAVAQERITGVASVIDGDTIEIHGQRIRLFGIDAQKAASFACAPMASVGVALNNRALRWRIGSAARRSVANRATSTAIVASLPSASKAPRTSIAGWWQTAGPSHTDDIR
jgi:endonuclease YncB( thermonuclease family)